MLNFIQENFWNIFMMFMGGISILISFSTFRKQNKLKKYGLMKEAKFVGFSKEKSSESSSSIKVPIFSFWYESDNGNNYYKVKGKTNSSCKIGETTPVYFNPENPEKEYYLPKKDFLMKYVLFFIGSFFFCLGYLYLKRKSNDFKGIYFLYLILSLFAGTLLMYLIGKIRNMKKK